MEEKKFIISVPADGVRVIEHGKHGGLEVVLEFETPEAVTSALLEFLRQFRTNPEVIQEFVARVGTTPLVYGSSKREMVQIIERIKEE